MWGYVLGAIAAGIALYELVMTRNNTAPVNPGAAPAPAASIPPDVARLIRDAPIDKQKAWADCNMAPNDLQDTNAWAQKYFSAYMPFIKRVALMKSVMPVAAWPDYARRTDCYLTKTKAYG